MSLRVLALAVLLASPAAAGIDRWTSTAGLPGEDVVDLAVDPRDAGVAYAATRWHGLYKTTDGGAHWSALPTGGYLGGITFAVVIDPSSPDTVYASLNGEVFKSLDAGASWTNVAPLLGAQTLAIDPSNANVVFAGRFNGMSRSDDGGATWLDRSSGLGAAQVFATAVDPSLPSVVYAGTYNAGLFRSVDGGETWALANTGLPPPNLGRFVESIVVAPDGTAFAGVVPGGVFRSTDRGDGWTDVGGGGLTFLTAVYAIGLHPAVPETLYVASSDGVLRTTTGGGSWSTVETGLPPTVGRGAFLALAVAPSAPATVYVGANGAGIFRTSDGGGLWGTATGDLTHARVQHVVADPDTPGTVFATTFGTGIYRSLNGGAAWNSIQAGLPSPYIAGTIQLPTSPKRLLASVLGSAAIGSRTFASDDDGSTWTAASTGLPVGATVEAFAFDPSSPAVVYAGLQTGRVYRSADRGSTWAPTGPGLPVNSTVSGVAVDPHDPNRIYAGVFADGVFRSSDAGASWQPASVGLPMFSDMASFLFDPTTPGVVLAGSRFGNVFRTTDSGASWSPASAGIPVSNRVHTLVADPATPGQHFAGIEVAGVYRNLGGNYVEFGFLQLPIFTSVLRALAISPSAPEVLYAGMDGDGVWSYSRTPCYEWFDVEDATLLLNRLASPAGDDTLRFSARTFSDQDPSVRGLRVRLVDAADVPVLDATIPPGTFDRGLRQGWIVAGSQRRSWHGSGSTTGGITRVRIRHTSEFEFRIRITARRTDLGRSIVAPAPLHMEIGFVPPFSHEYGCRRATFDGTTAPACEIRSRGRRLSCW